MMKSKKDNTSKKEYRVIYLNKDNVENQASVVATCEKEARDYVVNSCKDFYRILHVS